MLQSLHIENIALIEQANLDFHNGFNVLTGETGAGKSIVIDAIGSVIGERTSREIIRTGSDKAVVIGTFRNIRNKDWFVDHQIPIYDDVVQIEREIRMDGRGICRINGVSVTIALLKQIGLQFINIHGQHDAQQLFDDTTHLFYLDSFAKNDVLMHSYLAYYHDYDDLRKKILSNTLTANEKARKIDELSNQILEIEQANLQIGEEETLTEKSRFLRNAEAIFSAIAESVDCLNGMDNADGAIDLLNKSEHTLSAAERYSDHLQLLNQRLTSAILEIKDIAEELDDFRNSVDYSEREHERIESRLNLIGKLKKKYGNTIEEIMDYLANAKAQISSLEDLDYDLEKLNEKKDILYKNALIAAKNLHESRVTAASQLQMKVLEELHQLDMPNMQFQCEFIETEMNEFGTERIQFLMSANVGEALRPLNKVASGGEMARIMLALKNVLSEQESIDTLIFDEIDTGISGRAAQKVAEKMHALSNEKQVICVTHLPQIAAYADYHYCVSKSEHAGRTFTQVKQLSYGERIEEIARIIGGLHITQATRDSAEEMINTKGDKETNE